MKICRNCNTKVADDALVCPSCGCVMKKGSNAKSSNSATSSTRTVANGTKKKNTWLWVLGWLCIFPLPLTILMLRNQKLDKKIRIGVIAIAWIFYLIIVFVSGSGNSNNDGTKTSTGKSVEVSSNIKKLAISSTRDVTVKVGEKYSSSNVNAEVKKRDEFKPEDVVFVSDDPSVATIAFTKDALTTYLYFEITGVGAGETDVYAKAADGSVESEKIHVIVPTPILIDSISIDGYKSELVAGEKTSLKASFSPTNAEDKNLTWTSSDESVIKVDEKGNISAVGGGTATVTVTANNGINATADFNVDGSKTLMKLNVRYPREDDVNIGDEWSYDIKVNGERPSNTMGIAVGDKLSFSATITESDDNPDVGSKSTSHTVTEEDIANGFEVKMDVYVTENGGRNSGKSAHFVVIYTFTINN